MAMEFGAIDGIAIQMKILQPPTGGNRQPSIQVQIESAWRENAPGNRGQTKKGKPKKIRKNIYIMLL